jgi:F-type H+-transporting ATPase subunit epsilon
MASGSIELILVTPERQVLHENVAEVTLPGAAGELGVLPGHAPLITELGIGEMSYRPVDAKPSAGIAVVQGFAEVLGDRVTVLAETAERAAEIDLARAEAAKGRAEKHLANPDPNMDWDRAVVALQRALIRIQVARKYRGDAEHR